MAARPDDNDVDQLSGAMCAMSVEEDRLKELGLDDDVRAKMNEIKNDYESVFSWDIKRLTGFSQSLMSNVRDVVREKYELVMDEGNEFTINRFYLKLIICYELYDSGNYENSLLEVESIVKSLETHEFEDSNKLYYEACNHIALATYAYISLTLNLDNEKIIKTIKPLKSLNQAENAAVYAVKSRVFMEYLPKGNDIGLEFADLARNLNSTEFEWIIIWLKAKGRVRRYHDKNKMPDEEEIHCANMLCTAENKPRPLIQASKIYLEIAINHKFNGNCEESNKFYKISADLTYKAVELAKDNVKLLISCFFNCVMFPIQYQSHTILDDIIIILTNGKNNSHIDSVLGKYYLMHKKYQRAKVYLSRAMEAGHFGSAMQLIKVECLLQPEFPLINSLNFLYGKFPSPKRRLIILTQILIYYCYNEDNPKELMKYVKLYVEQDIENALKQQHLITAYPSFKTIRYFKQKQFLTCLSSEVKYLKNHHNWTPEEKIIIDRTLIQFNDMNTHTSGNQVVSNKSDQQKSYNKYSNKSYLNKNFGGNPSTVKDESNWRKKRNSFDKSDCQQNTSTSNNVVSSKAYNTHAFKKQSFVPQNKQIWE